MLTKRKLKYVRKNSLGVVLGSFLVHLAEEERAAWMLYFNCVVAVCVLCLFLAMPWVAIDMQSLIMAYAGHTHLIVF